MALEEFQHQAHGTFGIDARAGVIGTIELGHSGAKPREVKTPINPQQHMVVRDPSPHRTGDEQVRLTTFLPPRKRCRPAPERRSESEASGIFSGHPDCFPAALSPPGKAAH
ncbi:hypothetical protein HUK65_08855 [Rhodobacteraceae bacterium 2376]|uniref:Uncharacterized protein n=1 Tax=Rhabdonatronobacter sediminivivens TaxID=2743469 RepID=A0A7Z0KXT1_9RHOB|nr:hypothetical protein [Rhabdonatronobacter sediminivivens]